MIQSDTIMKSKLVESIMPTSKYRNWLLFRKFGNLLGLRLDTALTVKRSFFFLFSFENVIIFFNNIPFGFFFYSYLNNLAFVGV